MRTRRRRNEMDKNMNAKYISKGIKKKETRKRRKQNKKKKKREVEMKKKPAIIMGHHLQHTQTTFRIGVALESYEAVKCSPVIVALLLAFHLRSYLSMSPQVDVHE
jgi:hypothetical protein